ncbi:UNVERIFIED_CONTAM: hypothetical protein GTU68_043069 [Idotea baltica]|nr:hypothetical protein [Idotea baltica]
MTHLIAGTNPDENEIEEVKDIYEKPVVTSLWITYSAKCGKKLPYPFLSIYTNFSQFFL